MEMYDGTLKGAYAREDEPLDGMSRCAVQHSWVFVHRPSHWQSRQLMKSIEIRIPVFEEYSQDF